MKVLILGGIFIILCSLCYDLGSEDGNILWRKDLVLSWDNYRGLPDTSSQYKAKTFSEINVESSILEDVIVFQIRCSFIENRSWSKDKSSVKLLNHERLHFDIGELVTRKIRKEYCLHKSSDINKTAIALDRIYNKHFNQTWDSINFKYDSETEHGTIDSKQKEWEAKIAAELKKMDRYASTKVVIRRMKK